jgi:hypothetical protein
MARRVSYNINMSREYLIPISVLFIVGLMFIAASCASKGKPIETEPDFTGFITEIHLSQGNDISGQISIESDADKIVTKYSITIKSDTLLFRQEDGKLRNISFATFETKQWVKVWLSGPIKESWPLQGTAKQVVIIE